jgi:hypothetical protein
MRSTLILSSALFLASAAFSTVSHAATISTLTNPSTKSISLNGSTYVPTHYSHCANLTASAVVNGYYYCPQSIGVLTASQVSVINNLVYLKNPATSAIKISGRWYEPSDTSACKRFVSAIKRNGYYWCSTRIGSLSAADISQLSYLASNSQSEPAPAPTPQPTPTPAPTSYSAQLSWTPPSTRTDGTQLALSELAGYEIYYTSDDLSKGVSVSINGGSTSSYKITSLQAGTYHFAISAIDSNGIKSPLSAVVSKTFGQ